ncbi:prepilin-type N-terminal cleavage/methylation domain-containing protein [Colwellia demingiae]|uniref:Prepilin-type N-terminal cleavage/methylation domain-containing protein n=1 Tax=Colwellia demingiae TaxID=89401 RepID=A0A5C6Q8D4_9GAMM|nr:prepilin-type N-terminal cleavage/methylation domain-containing protein [Colwellia demingiae]TWX65186.1 prepilin-type N-terminal cleavage/methylation domain-containing protein [Colwellia demingiae]
MNISQSNFKLVNKQDGFTLIELVVVIIILGVIAVTAVPKYIDLQDDAKTASLQAIKGALESAIKLVYSKSIIKGNQNLARASGVDVDINGTTLDIKYGYPLANYASANGSWDDLIELDREFFSSTIVGGHFVIYIGEKVPTGLQDECMVGYKQVDGISSSPEITLNECG